MTNSGDHVVKSSSIGATKEEAMEPEQQRVLPVEETRTIKVANDNQKDYGTIESLVTMEDLETLGSIKRDLWINALYGATIGSFVGLFGGRYYHQYKTKQQQLSSSLSKLRHRQYKNNRYMGGFMLGGVFGALVCATTLGKNRVNELHPVFATMVLTRQKQMQDEKNYLQEKENKINDIYAEMKAKGVANYTENEERKRNRLVRRETLRNTLQRKKTLLLSSTDAKTKIDQEYRKQDEQSSSDNKFWKG